LTSNGFLAESIQHPSRLIFSGELQKSVRALISVGSISDALNEITGFDSFIRWQDMLFDKSTGTVDHADNWYLDTFPPGLMVGSWIALEDIHQDAGRFFVIPRSNHLDLPGYQQVQSHDKYLEIVIQRMQDENLERFSPELNAGDVLFWHSKTIHGSLSQRDEIYSRKSITAHYHPVGIARDKARGHIDILRYLRRMKSTNNPKIFFDDADPITAEFLLHGYARYFKRKLFRQKQDELVMTRVDGL
jgi:phytanoyl-CoA hydroxylase